MRRVPSTEKIPGFRSQLLLHPNGVDITQLALPPSQTTSIAAVDCIWPRLERLLRRVEKPFPVLASIPKEFVTAYPRRSLYNADPEGGLATIEALFIAAALIGHFDETLLSEYYFGRQFIELNRQTFLKYGINPSVTDEPTIRPRSKNSRERRQARGRVAKNNINV